MNTLDRRTTVTVSTEPWRMACRWQPSIHAGLPDAGPRDFPAAQAATFDLWLAERPRLGQLGNAA